MVFPAYTVMVGFTNRIKYVKFVYVHCVPKASHASTLAFFGVVYSPLENMVDSICYYTDCLLFFGEVVFVCFVEFIGLKKLCDNVIN